MKSRLRMAAVCAAAMFLAVGCLSATAEYTINPDGSGSAGYEIRIPAPLMVSTFESQNREIDFLTPEERCDLLWQQYNLDDLLFDVSTFQDVGIEVLKESIADKDICVSRARMMWLEEQADTVFEILKNEGGGMTFERSGPTGWQFTLSIDELRQEKVFTGHEEEFMEAFSGSIEDLSFELRVTLPGRPKDPDALYAFEYATRCDSTTFIWSEYLTGLFATLRAETDGSYHCQAWDTAEDVLRVLPWVMISLALGGFWFWLYRQFRRAEPGDPAPSTPEPRGGPAPEPSDPEPSSSS